MLVRRVHSRAADFAIAAFCLLACAGTQSAIAQQPADPDTIKQSIERGKKFLQSQQKPTGAWGDGDGAAAVGRTALVGVALVECGVPVTDPGIKRAASLVRQHANELDGTYELSLAILFLDRLKDQKEKSDKDKRVIQLLAGRLIAAQMPSGGWGYKAQKYQEANILQLVAALKKVSAATPEKPVDVAKIRSKLPEDMSRLPIWTEGSGRLPADPLNKGQDLYDATTDNSTTHFAMIGLWTARKYEIPVDRTFALVNRRFRTSQGPGGTWSYPFVRTGADGGPQFTCIALLGLAIGHVVAPEPGVKPEDDKIIINAFASLQKTVGEPVGNTKDRPKVKDIGGLYFLWAMERIAVLYDLQKLGKKDWYLWGAEILISNQSAADGSWDEDGGFPGQSPIVNTSFALLFLKRANLIPDLSKRLVVNTTALVAKVDDKIAPKVEPPPAPKVIQQTVVEVAPPPHAVVPKPQPTQPTAVALPAPEPETPAAPAKKSPWLWIVLGVLMAGLAGGGLAFLVVKRRKKDEDEEEDEDEQKKKKKGKKKVKAKAKVEVEEDEE